MNFIEASLAPLKNTGQIKIHTEADFEGMRAVGRLVHVCAFERSAEAGTAAPEEGLTDGT